MVLVPIGLRAAERTVLALEDDSLPRILGRVCAMYNSANCITDHRISREHLRIVCSGPVLHIKQLGRNPCKVRRHDGNVLTVKRTEELIDVALEPNDVIMLIHEEHAPPTGHETEHPGDFCAFRLELLHPAVGGTQASPCAATSSDRQVESEICGCLDERGYEDEATAQRKRHRTAEQQQLETAVAAQRAAEQQQLETAVAAQRTAEQQQLETAVAAQRAAEQQLETAVAAQRAAERRATWLEQQNMQLRTLLDGCESERQALTVRFRADKAALEEEKAQALNALEAALEPAEPGALTQAFQEVCSGLQAAGVQVSQDEEQAREKEVITNLCLYVEKALDQHYAHHPAVPPTYHRLSFHEKLRSLRVHCGLPDALHALADERLRPWRNRASHPSEHLLPPREDITKLIHELKEELAKLPPPPGPRLVGSVPAPVELPPAPPVDGPGNWLRRNLQCPFQEKDKVKQLGARWDPIHKIWFVPAGVDPTPFRQWWK